MDHFSYEAPFTGTAADPVANRGDARDSLLLSASFRVVGEDAETQVRVRNLSAGGLMAELSRQIDRGAPVEVNVRGVGWVSGYIAWVAAGRIGVAFDQPIDPLAARKPVVAPRKRTTLDKPIKPLL